MDLTLTLNIILNIFYIATAITTLYSFVRLKEANIYVALYVFVGFFFLGAGELLALLSLFFDFNSYKIAVMVVFTRSISVIYLLKTVIGIRSAITEKHSLTRKKIFNLLFISVYFTFLMFLLAFTVGQEYSNSIFPVVFSSNRLNLLIAIMDSFTMLLVVIHLPGFKEYIWIRIGSSTYGIASWLLYFSTLGYNFNFLLLSQIFYLLNPIINTIAILTLYYNKSKLTKQLLLS
jgi:hypothetical protein